LIAVGATGDRLALARDALLGIGRVAPFVLSLRKGWIIPEFQARLEAVVKDVVSLNDYEGHLSNKVQFLLDAILGFISVQQNDIFKVLTIVSVVGIPPTLVAGIYGMNFKYMPELNWISVRACNDCSERRYSAALVQMARLVLDRCFTSDAAKRYRQREEKSQRRERCYGQKRYAERIRNVCLEGGSLSGGQ
jgi:CorA-like Mg2+ transporter protein